MGCERALGRMLWNRRAGSARRRAYYGKHGFSRNGCSAYYVLRAVARVAVERFSVNADVLKDNGVRLGRKRVKGEGVYSVCAWP